MKEGGQPKRRKASDFLVMQKSFTDKIRSVKRLFGRPGWFHNHKSRKSAIFVHAYFKIKKKRLGFPSLNIFSLINLFFL